MNEGPAEDKHDWGGPEIVTAKLEATVQEKLNAEESKERGEPFGPGKGLLVERFAIREEGSEAQR